LLALDHLARRGEMRRLTVSGGFSPPSASEIEALERVLRRQLPTDLREFFATHNGGIPQEAFFVQDGQPRFLIEYLTPMTLSLVAKNPAIPTGPEYRIWTLNIPGEEPKQALPLASGGFGFELLYSLDAQSFGQIFYFHPDTDAREKHLRFLANSLDEFLDGLVDQSS
jgi:SMI1-KNR4 cell-wall